MRFSFRCDLTMKEYDVTITETLEKTVSVTASSREEAEEQVQRGYFNSEYVLDSENFAQVNFSVGEEREAALQGDTLDVLLVRTGEFPQRIQIGNELGDIQAAVGGYFQEVPLGDGNAAILCNEEGKINGMPLNRALRDEDGQTYDIVAGDFLIVGVAEDDFASLSPEQAEKYEEEFHSPQTFVKTGHSWIVIPIDDNKVKNTTPDREQDAARKASPIREER